MIELARALGLAGEPRAHHGARRVIAEQHLERVALVRQVRVGREVDAAHAAHAEQLVDA